MKFTRITAHAHGPFTGEILTPAPGFTVVWGLNEAGKSSWHSATYLAITGLSRRRGRPPKAEQEIIDRRRPRAGDQWRLEADLCLDDGENLTVTWDLDQKVAKVLDSLGRDRSNEWLTDGAPDLARIVGLDRASFLATACVRQSDLHRVRDDAGLLQELLQKATTSADADATASAAIALIEQFHKEQVGLERGNSTKPLMEAKRRVEATGQALHVAQAAHRERLDLLADLTDQRAASLNRHQEHQILQAALAVVDARRRHNQIVQQGNDLDQLVQQVDALTTQVDHLDRLEHVLLAARHHADRADVVRTIERQVTDTAAARRAATDADQAHNTVRQHLAWAQHEQARRTAHRSRQRLTRATELHHRHPTAPATATDHDALAHRAHVLVDRWSKRPDAPALSGPTSHDLAQQLAAISDSPVEHRTNAPAGRPDADTSSLEHRHPGTPSTADRPEPTPSTIGVIGAIGATVLGVALGIVVHPALYLVAVAGIVATLLALRHHFRPGAAHNDGPNSEFQERLERAEAAQRAGQQAALTAQLTHRRGQEQHVAEAQAILGQLDHDLAELAADISADLDLPASQRADAIARWLAGHADQRRHLQTAHHEWAELTNLLGAGTIDDLADQADHHQQIWQERVANIHQLDPPDEDLQGIDDRLLRDRVHQLTGAAANAAREAAKLAGQLPGTDPQLALPSARREAEEALSQLRQLDAEAAGQLFDRSTDDIHAQLATCRHQRGQRTRDRDESAGHLRHLRETGSDPVDTWLSHSPTSLDAGPATDPSADARSVSASHVLHREQAFLALPVHDQVGFTLDELPPVEVLQSRIETVADQEDQLHQLVAGLEGRLQERDAPGASAHPATAAEHHEAARQELDQVRELADVLDETRSLLEAAEDRVHRDIAPRLNAATNRWLPRIFGDRYTKVLIDPASLDVQVFASGEAHRADLLSQGTTEQFYLLLRVALTDTLTAAADESCPLLLDEVTVNFDRDRKVAVLELLREVAAERQVMLFTQEDDVRAWAEDNLSGSDTLIELPGRVAT